jgi:hypothetical protein
MAYQQQTDGDMGFKGFASRLNPIALEPGMLQAVSNCRLERGVITARKGLAKLIGETLTSDTLVTSYAYTDINNLDQILLICLDGLYKYTPEQLGQPGTLSSKKNFATGRFMSTTFLLATETGANLTAENGARLTEGTPSSVKYDVQGPFPGPPTFDGQEHFVIFRGRSDEAVVTATFSKPNGTSVTVTVTTPSAHGYSVGEEVGFYTFDNNITSINNNYIITSIPSPTTFTFFYTGITNTQHTNIVCYVQRNKPPLFWDGVTSTVDIVPQTKPSFMVGTVNFTSDSVSTPPGDFGLSFQNRLVVAYKRNKLAVSDILDYRTFDLTLNNFTINTGLNDTLVGVLPWIENQFLVFMQKSIYICYIETSSYVAGSAPGVNSSITVVTTELGCAARRTIVSAGQFVFFLSNRGVNMLTPQLDLKLIGNTTTLSNPIDDWIQRINYSYVSFAYAAYFNNRFWLSVAIDEAQSNSHLLIYNTLNDAWESVDTYQPSEPSTVMGADEMHVAQYKSAKQLFIIRKFDASGTVTGENGGVYVNEQAVDGDYVTSTTTAGPILSFTLPAILTEGTSIPSSIEASFKSRQYILGTLQEKFYSNIQVVSKSSTSQDQIAVSVSTSNQDITQNNGVISFTDVSDKTYRDRIGLRGYAIDATLSLQKGQPEVRAITITGSVASRPMVSQQ